MMIPEDGKYLLHTVGADSSIGFSIGFNYPSEGVNVSECDNYNGKGDEACVYELKKGTYGLNIYEDLGIAVHARFLIENLNSF